MFGFDIIVRDADGHKVSYEGRIGNKTTEPVFIGNHVWIAADASILKGSAIADDCVVGFNSCVMSKFEMPNSLIGGYPAKVLRSGIEWQN